MSGERGQKPHLFGQPMRKVVGFSDRIRLGEWQLVAVLECGHRRDANYGHSKRLRCGDCPPAFSTDGLHGIRGRKAQADALSRRKAGLPIFRDRTDR